MEVDAMKPLSGMGCSDWGKEVGASILELDTTQTQRNAVKKTPASTMP